MRARPMLLAVAAACGSPAGVVSSAPDATIDVDAAFDDDAATADADVYVPKCPDGGAFITIDGDGPTRTLRSNDMPPVFYFALPNAPWAQGYYAQGLVVGGSDNPDGGASLRLDVEIKENADGGMMSYGPGAAYSDAWYVRPDGTSFAPAPGLSASMTLTEEDPVGGFVGGSYTASVVSSDAGALSLSGTFLTCRLPDFVGPTPPHP